MLDVAHPALHRVWVPDDFFLIRQIIFLLRQKSELRVSSQRQTDTPYSLRKKRGGSLRILQVKKRKTVTFKAGKINSIDVKGNKFKLISDSNYTVTTLTYCRVKLSNIF